MPGTISHLRQLVPVFFARFFENALTARTDDLKTAFFGALAILAVPGFVLPLMLSGASAPVPAASGFGTDPGGWGWSMVAQFQGTDVLRSISRADKTFYLGFAMIAAAVVSLICWNALLVDRRDRLVLGALPVRQATVVLAKLIALSAYVAGIAIAMHTLASVAFGIALAANNTAAFALRGIAAHFLASFAASVLVLLSVVAVQGMTMALLGPRRFSQVSPILQMGLVALVVGGAMALPAISGSVVDTLRRTGDVNDWSLAAPPLWFLGLYERVLGTSDLRLLDLARTATRALSLACTGMLVFYLVAHTRMKSALADLQAPRVRHSSAALGLAASALARDAQIRAVAGFFLTTIARSHRHRLVLASAAGAALAWGLPGWLSLADPPHVPRLDPLSGGLAVPFFLVIGLRVATLVPGDLKGSWVFDLSAVPWRVARAAVERSMVFAVALPLVVLSAGGYWWLWGFEIALLHTLFACSTALLLVQAMLWRFDAVPCTRPWNQDAARLRNAWPFYLAAAVTVSPGLPGLELVLLSQPIACLCFAVYVLALAWHIRVKSLDAPPLPDVEAVDVLTAALRAAPRNDSALERPGRAGGASAPARMLADGARPGVSSEWRAIVARFRPAHLPRDVRLACRRLAAAPVFTLFSIATLGCGVGVTTAVYSVVYAVLWTSPPVHDIDRLLDLSGTDGRSQAVFTWSDYLALSERQSAFSGLAAATVFQVPFVGGAVAEVVQGEAVNGTYFHTLGVRPVAGRLIQQSDDSASAPAVVVLSYSVWRLRFGADPGIVGRTVKMEGRPYEIIGVAPDGFHGWDFDNRARPATVWVPLATAPADVQARSSADYRDVHWLVVKGRLAPGWTIERASSEMLTIGRMLEAQLPTRGADPRLGVQSRYGRRWSAGPIRERDGHRLGLVGRMFICAVALVLLIGCTNLANLALARGSSREHELAVRRALGASRGDLVREQLAESVVVALAGAGLAALIIRAATSALTVEIPAGAGRFVLLEPHLNLPVLAFAGIAGLLALITSGIWPALQLTQTPAREGLSTDGGTTPPHWRTHRRLIGWQVAASVALFLVAAACINVVVVSAVRETGVDIDRLAIVSIDFDTNRYDAARTRAATEALLAVAAAQPQIAAVAASGSLPFGVGNPRAYSASTTGDASTSNAVQFVSATPQIFRALGVRILDGRGLAAHDSAHAPRVAVVNQAFALKLWGPGAAVGREIVVSTNGPARRGRPPSSERLTIVGVAADTDVGRAGSREHGVVYVPLEQHPQTNIIFTARSDADPRAALLALRTALRHVDPEFVVEHAASGTMYLAGHYVVLGFVAAVITTLGSLALLLAMSGLFGVISHAVSRRTRELGVRIALGAESPRIMRMIFAEGLRPVADGLILGLFAGAVCRAVIKATVSPSVAAVDPIAFVIVPIVFVATALGACYCPARRAASVDPNVALRQGS